MSDALFVVHTSGNAGTLRVKPDGRDYWAVLLHANGVRAETRVEHMNGDGLDRFFAKIAAKWQDRGGEETWECVDGCFALKASRDRAGHVRLMASLRPPYDAWRANITLCLDGGEQLKAIARAADKFIKTELDSG